MKPDNIPPCRTMLLTVPSLLALARGLVYLPRDSASSVTPDKQTTGKRYIIYRNTLQAPSPLVLLPSKIKIRPAAVQELQ